MTYPMRVLEGLTPGGSEYHNDPERCAAYVRDRLNQQHRLIVRFKKQRDLLLEAVKKANTCRASMNTAVADLIGNTLQTCLKGDPYE